MGTRVVCGGASYGWGEGEGCQRTTTEKTKTTVQAAVVKAGAAEVARAARAAGFEIKMSACVLAMRRQNLSTLLPSLSQCSTMSMNSEWLTVPLQGSALQGTVAQDSAMQSSATQGLQGS